MCCLSQSRPSHARPLHPNTNHTNTTNTASLSSSQKDGIIDKVVDAVRTPLVPLPASSSSSAAAKPAAGKHLGAGTKVTTKHVYDCAKGELKSRTEFRLPDTGARVGLNYSDRASLVSVDVERGEKKKREEGRPPQRRKRPPAPAQTKKTNDAPFPLPLKTNNTGAYRLGYDLTREDVLAQVKRKTSAGTITVRQLVPGLRWAVVPSPVVEIATKLVDTGSVRDSLKLVYDFHARQAFYTETLKGGPGGKFKVRVAGDSKTGDHAFCAGYKPGTRWLKSLKCVHTASAGPVLSYKLKPFPGWKLAAEAATKQKVASASLAFKALKGDAEVVLDAAVPYGEGIVSGLKSARVLRRAGLKCDFVF